MSNPQTQINTKLIQQNLIQTSIDMNSSSNKVSHRNSSRPSRRKDKSTKLRDRDKRHKSRSGRSRSRDRDRKKERRHYDLKRNNRKDRTERKERNRTERDRKKRDYRRNGIIIHKSDRKRRRSPLLNDSSSINNRKFKNHDDLRRKRRKLNKNGFSHPSSVNNVTFDIKINNHENINAVKDIKNLVSNSKNSTNMNIANIPAVLQEPNTKTSVHGPHGNGNVTNSKRSKRNHRSNSRSASDTSTSSYSESDKETRSSDADSESASDASSSYSDTDYSTDSNSSSDEGEDIKNKRDRERRKPPKPNRNHRDKRRPRVKRIELHELRDRPRRRGSTPNWLRHQEKEWFKAMEMLTKFNHRKNYRDKFLAVFEQSVYGQFEHFWADKSPEPQEIKSLEVLFEKTYFEHFNSIRQVREYQQNIQRQQNQQAMIVLNQALNNNKNNKNNVASSSSYPQVQNIQNIQRKATKIQSNNPPQQDLLSMLNLGDDLNANIQNIQALLAMSAQQQTEQSSRRTLRVPPRLLQQNNTVAPLISAPPPTVPPPQMMQMTLQPPTVRKPAALRQQKRVSPSPVSPQIIADNTQIVVNQSPQQTVSDTKQTTDITAHIESVVPVKPTLELPTPEPIVEENESKSISATVEMPPSPKSQMEGIETNEAHDDEEEANDVTDEQICQVLNIPPPPTDPRLSKENTPNNCIDIDVDMEDETMSVISDVVTEDDIIISSPINKKQNDNDSTDSMSPEVAIEPKRISDASHAISIPNEEDDDIDFTHTLNVLGDFLSNDTINNCINHGHNDILNDKMDIDEAKPIAQNVEMIEMKTNSTNVAAVNAMIGIETSWLFSDESDLENGGNLPGMATTEATQPILIPDNPPSHYIPPPSYYNPPAPGQDVDRRQINRNENDTTSNPTLQPRRRAIRRRPKANKSDGDSVSKSTISINGLTDLIPAPSQSPKPRAAGKKRGFFNRIRKQTTDNNMDKPKMIKSRINSTMNNTITRKPVPKRMNNSIIPRSFGATNIVRKKQSPHPMVITNRKVASNVLLAQRNAKRRTKHLIPKSNSSVNTIDLTASSLNTKNKPRVRPKQTLKTNTKSMILPSASKSRSNTPSASNISLNNKNKKPITSKSNVITKIPTNQQRKMVPSKVRHYQDLGPRLEAPPTDLSALFDENPIKSKKKSDKMNTKAKANPVKTNTKPATTNGHSNGNPHPNPNPPLLSYYPPPPYPQAYYPPNGYYPPPPYPQPPPPGYYPPNGYYPPPNGYYPSSAPIYANTMSNKMVEANKYKKIAKYRDNIFYPDGYKKWSRAQYMDHIDNQIHGRTKLLLFLDIDHTILHSTRDKRGANYLNHPSFGSDIFEINFPNQYNASYFIKFRPGFRRLVQELTPLYDFVLYTMGSRSYAEQVAMVIDCNFRKYTPEFAQNKHNKTFIIGNRIICREDHGDISDKDYKKDIGQFAPINGNWCMIIDDVPEVWRNRDDIHRVPKYLFWPNPDKTAPGTNHKHCTDGTNNKINIWSKNSITSWNDDKSLFKQEKDNVLIQSIEISKAVHECYYAKYTPSNDSISAPSIFSSIRCNVMKNTEIVFTGVFPQKNAKNDFHWKLAQLFGANVKENITDSTTHLIGKESKTSKIQQAIRNDNIEIVHINWLYQTLFNFGFADCNRFRMFISGDDKHTPKMHCLTKVKSKRELVAMYQNNIKII